MVNIKLPNGQVKQFELGITPLKIAETIANKFSKNILVAEFNNSLIDLTSSIFSDGEIKFFLWEDEIGKQTFWHSSAHLMAEAVTLLYPKAKFWVGPPITSGFYYDIDFGDDKIQNEDLQKIEETIYQLLKNPVEFQRKNISKKDAWQYFTDKNDPYKLDLLTQLEDGNISFYTQGNFTDLCRGPHIPNTKFITEVKLTSVAGAYWKGNDKNKMLTRIYGISFPTKKELAEYNLLQEEIKKRDHRKLGKDLKIYTTDDEVGPGLILWLPNGTVIIEELEKLAKETELKQGYKRVVTPHIGKEELYVTSGHLPFYKDSMFPPMVVEGQHYYLKAMNCPHHHKIFASETRSYKDLPLRLAEYGTCYRYEQSGELFGLMRVRCLHMNDAHIYCSKEQFAQEFKMVNEMYLHYFNTFGIEKYLMRLSLHDPEKLGEKYINEPVLWQETEEMVRQVLKDTNTPFVEIKDEAAFYGPKIDVQIFSAIGREFTLATNQVDFAQGRRFNLSFINANNQPETPLIIHRAPLGTHERFIGFLLEHFAGRLPTWLAPLQVKIIPISENYFDYSQQVYKKFLNHNIRVELDLRNEKMGKKIRFAEIEKIPFMVILGEKELSTNSLTIRKHNTSENMNLSFDEFLNYLLPIIKNKL